MNTRQLHSTLKPRGSSDVSYLGRSVDEMIYSFMEENDIPGVTLAIVQAPYIPRVVGYGLSDARQRRLASANTMWPAGPISQAFAAVAIMQLYELGRLDIHAPVGTFINELPESWKKVPLLSLLRHSSGLPDYRNTQWQFGKPYRFDELLANIAAEKPHFQTDTGFEESATNFLLLTEVIERISGKSYHDFVTEHQINFLHLKHTGFAEDLKNFNAENVTLTDNIHQIFKSDGHYIDPTEAAASYNADGSTITHADSSSLRGFSDIWASAQDISFWDIGLAGSVLIHKAENRALVYAPWKTINGEEIPSAAGWHFYHHRGFMDIGGSVPGFSSYLSRFTHPEELVCVTLLANKEGVDFSNLARCIAGAFGDLLSTNYDDNRLYLFEGQLSVERTVKRLKDELVKRGIPVFAEFDHAENARKVGLALRPTTVIVFGAPKVGTALMQADQSISVALPLRISIWEDEAGSTWLAFPRLELTARDWNMDGNETMNKMNTLMKDLVKKAGRI